LDRYRADFRKAAYRMLVNRANQEPFSTSL
jgi:hypothetical protein